MQWPQQPDPYSQYQQYSAPAAQAQQPPQQVCKLTTHASCGALALCASQLPNVHDRSRAEDVLTFEQPACFHCMYASPKCCNASYLCTRELCESPIGCIVTACRDMVKPLTSSLVQHMHPCLQQRQLNPMPHLTQVNDLDQA